MKTELKRQLPNLITISRLAVLTPLTVYLIVNKHAYWGLFFFIITALSDKLDGVLARRYGPTEFGRVMDPIADKIFVIGVLFSIAVVCPLPPVIIIIIILREVMVTVIRYLPNGNEVEVNLFGKIKATCQYIGLGYAILIWPFYIEAMALVAAITVLSGLMYVYRYAKIVSR